MRATSAKEGQCYTTEMSSLLMALDGQRPSPALAMDGDGEIALVMISADIIAVSVRRMHTIPPVDIFIEHMQQESWLGVSFSQGDHICFYPSEVKFSLIHQAGGRHTPTREEERTASLAVGLGLGLWPRWGARLRKLYPRQVLVSLPHPSRYGEG